MPAPSAAVLQPAEPLRESVTLDLNALKKRLKETKSIGLFSKLSLKNKVDDLLDDFRDGFAASFSSGALPADDVTALALKYVGG
jgi:hypothetical protein